MPTGQKHLITCRCVLPQFKQMSPPPPHQFVVFTVIEDSGDVRVKFCQCNNCGIVHKVIDVCRSEIVNAKEALNSVLTIDDIKVGMPANLVNLLEQNSVDLPTWEAAQFILENKHWGAFITLNSDEEDGVKQGKYVRILGESLFKVETFTRNEFVK